MKRKKKISMKDISRELGISITTISFIVNNKAENKISKEVIKRVEDYIAKVDYKPNSSAQSLRTGKSKLIVFMVEDISDPFFSAIARRMEEIAFYNNYNLIYCSTGNSKERTLELIQLFKERQVDAFIITPPENFQLELEKLIYEEHQIVMVFDRYFEGFKHNYVVLENRGSAKMAVEAIYKSGKRNIAFIGIDSELSTLVDRRIGYLEAINNYQLKDYQLLFKFEQVRTLEGKGIIEKFLKDNEEIDAILFATNNLALNGLRVLREKKIEIPNQIAIVSFDERDVFELHSPPISVISQPISELASELIESTLNILKKEKNNSNNMQKVFSGELIRRESL